MQNSSYIFSEYVSAGVRLVYRTGQAGWQQIKIHDKNTSHILHESYDEEAARSVWRLFSILLSEK